MWHWWEKDFNKGQNKNRGGLWFISEDAQKYFQFLEYLFRKNTTVFKTVINYDLLKQKDLDDTNIIAYYKNIWGIAGVEVGENSMCWLEMIVGLYTRLRWYLYENDIKKRHEVKEKSVWELKMKDKAFLLLFPLTVNRVFFLYFSTLQD